LTPWMTCVEPNAFLTSRMATDAILLPPNVPEPGRMLVLWAGQVIGRGQP
jgi:hypothetical protein